MSVHAFDPNYILSDYELLDEDALQISDIQRFLDRGFLGSYETEDHNGVTRSAAEIIYNVSQEVGISPKFLLVLLQKEQSLIEDNDPTDRQLDWATGYAVCDSCSKDDPTIQRWKGFGKQVNSAALQYVEGYLEDIKKTGKTGAYGPGITTEISGTEVTPANAATAAMYAYTPHLHGNELFVSIWNEWFQTHYPSGTLVKTDTSPDVWLIEYGMKRPIKSMSALLSRFNPDLIVTISETQLANYADGRPIAFPNYSLLMDEDGNIYLLVDDALRHIESMETFRAIGFMLDEVVEISNDDISQYAVGNPITESSLYPQGNLLKTEGSQVTFFVQDGYRHVISDDAILEARFPNKVPQTVLPMVIEQFIEGPGLLFPDGVLVKSDEEPTVYVVSEGILCAIPTEEIFEAYGWQWENVLTAKQRTIEKHEIGLPIESPTFLTE